MLLKKTVGLVLGCGSSRGWAHIGAIEALEDANIPIDLIVGCSIGSYVGAIYASGSIKSLREFVLKMDGKKVVLKSGNILAALRASMSTPGLFAPARVKNRWLVDGGLVDPVPVSVARAMGADIVIAVDLSSGIISKQKRKMQKFQSEKTPVEQEENKNELIEKLSDYYENAGF